MSIRFFDDDGKPLFKSLGKFRIIWFQYYRTWYASKFIYNPSGDPETIYDGYQEYEYSGETVMTLVKANGYTVTVIPKRFLEEIKP